MTTLVYITREEWEKMNPHDREVLTDILRRYGISVRFHLYDDDVNKVLLDYLKQLVNDRGLNLVYTYPHGRICYKDALVREVMKRLGYDGGCIKFTMEDLRIGIRTMLEKITEYLNLVGEVRKKITEFLAESVANSLKSK